MIEISRYIKAADISDEPIRYDWDDNDPSSYYRDNFGFETKISKICIRGIVALSTGYAEWIAWRLNNYSKCPILFQAVEAVWAGIVDWSYMAPLAPTPYSPRSDEWRGAERAPICEAFYNLIEVVESARRSKSALGDCSSLSQLAAHILPNKKSFKEWQVFAIDRLMKLYPRTTSDILGPPLPREVLDPNFDYIPEMAVDLISKYLQNLAQSNNPFLNLPEMRNE
jgi:hypothetical protein